jgi:MFS family permease
MPSPVTLEYSRSQACMKCGFKVFYYALLPFSLHWSMISFINSSFLETIFSPQIISALFITGSLITLISFLFAGSILNRLGAIRTITLFTLAELTALLGIVFLSNPILIILFFATHVALVPFIMFTLDVIMEELIGNNEEATGSKRGIYLTIAAFMGALSALIMGFLVGAGTPNFTLVYLVSGLLLIPFMALVLHNFSDFRDPPYPQLRVVQNLNSFWHRKDIRNVFSAHLLLQIFFSWTVIYMPLYLATVIGYNWEQIGVIIFVGLLAYVFFEYPTGLVADKYAAEKEIMSVGFLILAVSVASFAFLDASSMILWMIVMFLTRAGASLVEVSTESYFFKQMKGEDVGTIGIYRVAQPLGFIIGPILGGTLLAVLPFSLIFPVLGIVMTFGFFFAMALHDTR